MKFELNLKLVWIVALGLMVIASKTLLKGEGVTSLSASAAMSVIFLLLSCFTLGLHALIGGMCRRARRVP